MSTKRKPRKGGPKLGMLPLAQRESLVRWMTREGMTYEQIRARLLDEFGVKTSTGALSNFWNEHCAPLLARKSDDGLTASAGGLTVEIHVRPATEK